MVVSLKANKKRIIAFIILAAVVVGACIFLRSGKGGEEQNREITGGTNEERVAFLESFGWQVDAEPAETREVMIPAQFNDVYTTYNVMQKAQGFDLKPHAGETCTQYKYKINNYPNEPEVYATLLVRGDLIIGGDIACSEVDGFMHGFAKDSARYGETAGTSSEAPESSMPSENSAPASSAPASESSSVSTSVESGAASETASSAAASAVESEASAASAAGDIEEDAYPTD